MKNQKGVTLISLTIYIISLTVIIAMLSIISTYFYKNVNEAEDDITPLTEYTNFNSYFTADINTSYITYFTSGEDGNKDENDYYCYILLCNENNSKPIKYIYVKRDKTIYRETEDATIAVARNVTSCEFEEGVQTGNNRIPFNIKLKIGNHENEKTYNYSLNY